MEFIPNFVLNQNTLRFQNDIYLVQPLIKWPGGKSRELKIIKMFLKELNFDKEKTKYFSPFFGGGALFFDLQPKHAYLNDIDSELVNFYNSIKYQEKDFFVALSRIENDLLVLEEIAYVLKDEYIEIYDQYEKNGFSTTSRKFRDYTQSLLNKIDLDLFSRIVTDQVHEFVKLLSEFIQRKIAKTSNLKKKGPLHPYTHELQFETALKSSYYTYIRDFLYNQKVGSSGERTAYFYYIREFCFGSMFRYNRDGEFNIPYGGANYNKKNFSNKIKRLGDQKLVNHFRNGVKFYNHDFKEYLDLMQPFIDKNDFVFFDPPYHTEFSDYSNNEFTKKDHEDLARSFAELKCYGMMVIKRTDFIYHLYKNLGKFIINRFSKKYTYNVRGRNIRDATHLIITNYDPKIDFQIIKN